MPRYLENPAGGVTAPCICCVVNLLVWLIEKFHLSNVYAPSVGVTVAPAFLWSITIAPLMMRFLKPKSFDALIVPISAIIQSPQWQNDISYQSYY